MRSFFTLAACAAVVSAHYGNGHQYSNSSAAATTQVPQTTVDMTVYTTVTTCPVTLTQHEGNQTYVTTKLTTSVITVTSCKGGCPTGYVPAPTPSTEVKTKHETVYETTTVSPVTLTYVHDGKPTTITKLTTSVITITSCKGGCSSTPTGTPTPAHPTGPPPAHSPEPSKGTLQQPKPTVETHAPNVCPVMATVTVTVYTDHPVYTPVPHPQPSAVTVVVGTHPSAQQSSPPHPSPPHPSVVPHSSVPHSSVPHPSAPHPSAPHPSAPYGNSTSSAYHNSDHPKPTTVSGSPTHASTGLATTTSAYPIPSTTDAAFLKCRVQSDKCRYGTDPNFSLCASQAYECCSNAYDACRSTGDPNQSTCIAEKYACFGYAGIANLLPPLN